MEEGGGGGEGGGDERRNESRSIPGDVYNHPQYIDFHCLGANAKRFVIYA